MEHQKLLRDMCLGWTLQKHSEMRFGWWHTHQEMFRRPWKQSREVGPGRKEAREAASLTRRGLWGQRGPQGVGARSFRHRAWAVPGTLAVLSVRARGGLQPEGSWGRQGWLLGGEASMAAGGADRALALMPQQTVPTAAINPATE